MQPQAFHKRIMLGFRPTACNNSKPMKKEHPAAVVLTSSNSKQQLPPIEVNKRNLPTAASLPSPFPDLPCKTGDDANGGLVTHKGRKREQRLRCNAPLHQHQLRPQQKLIYLEILMAPQKLVQRQLAQREGLMKGFQCESIAQQRHNHSVWLLEPNKLAHFHISDKEWI